MSVPRIASDAAATDPRLLSATIGWGDRCHPEPTPVILSAAKDLPPLSDYKFTITDMGGSSSTASQIITV